MKPRNMQLGLGLIGIGKPWGLVPNAVPSDAEAQSLLEYAFELGIRYFDTAPSYGDGVSETRLGRFVKTLGSAVTVATKFGEHWNDAGPFAGHSFDALRRSLDTSLARLGRVDVLQLHKTTPENLASDDVRRAWEYAASLGITCVGPSVSDLRSGEMAVDDPRFQMLQLPFNRTHTVMASIVDGAAAKGKWLAVNRPFAMGALVDGDAFRFILDRVADGVILTGTTSKQHLLENWTAFVA